MKLAVRAKALGKKLTLMTTAFVLAVSSLTALTPFVLAETANAIGGQSRFVAMAGSDTTDCSDGVSPCLTIAYAISQSSDNDVINIGAGDFTESFVVDRTVALKGAGQGATTIKAPATFANGKDHVAITGAGKTIQLTDLTIDGVSDAYSHDSAGVHVYGGANAVINNVDVQNVHKTIVDTTYIYGILVGTRSGSVNNPGTATITNTSVTNYGRGGVYVSGHGSYATLSGNSISADSSFTGLLNGVLVEYGANANIQSNTVQGNWYAGSGWSGAGITVWDDANATTIIKNNTVTGNQVGLGVVTDSPAVLTNINVNGITGNDVNARLDSPDFASWGYWPWAAPSTVYVNSSVTADDYSIVMADGKAVVKGYNLFSNAQDAVDAVATNGTVKLLKDLHVNAPILITKALTFDGNGLSVVSSFTPGSTSPYSGVFEIQGVDGSDSVRFVANNNKAFRIYGQGATAIDGPGSYNGLHGINVYDSNVELNKVILSNNGKSGLNVGRNSTAVVNDITTLNNTWYGINVDKTTSGSFSTLTVNGTSTHNEGTKAHIFSDSRTNVNDGSVKVNDPNSQYVRYWDGNGYKYVLDLSAPTVNMTVNTYNPASFKTEATDDQRLVRIDYSIWKNNNTVQVGVWGQNIGFENQYSFEKVQDTYCDRSSGSCVYKQFADLADGTYTLRATVSDVLGKTTNATSRTFTVDHTAPTITISSSNGKTALNLFHEVSFKLHDATSLIDRAELNGTPFASNHGHDYGDLNNVWANKGWSGAVEGANTLVLFDMAGNSATYNFTLDNTAPIVTINGVIDGALYNADVTVHGTIDEPNLNNYYLTVTKDGTVVNIPGVARNGTSNNVDFTLSDEGDYMVKLAARDKLGVKDGTSTVDGDSVKTVYFTIDKTGIVATANDFTRADNVITPVVDTNGETPVSQSWTQVSGPVGGVQISDPTILAPSFTVLQDGSYVFQLKLVDTAGNESLSLFSFSYTTPVTTTGGDEGDNDDGDDADNNGGFNGPAFISPATADQLGASDEADDSTPAVDGASTEKNLAEAVNNTDGSAFGLAWYWWLLIVAGLATILWWIIAAARRRQAEN